MAAVIALLFWQPWATSGSGSASGGSRSGVTGSGAVTSGNDLGTHTDGSDTGSDSDSDSTSNSTYGSGSGAEESSPTPTPTPTPTPDTTDRAFAAVRAGDCLDVYNAGHDNMSARTPVRVGCRASNAYMHVNRVSTAAGAGSSCDSGPGFTWWRKAGADGVERTLCLDRVYQVGQCFPAQVKGATNADLTVVWDCGASTVPRALPVDPPDHRLLPGARGGHEMDLSGRAWRAVLVLAGEQRPEHHLRLGGLNRNGTPAPGP